MQDKLISDQDEYVSIYKVAAILGKNISTLINEKRHRDRFISYLDNLPNNILKKIELNEPKLISEGYPPVMELFSLTDLRQFITEHISLSKTMEALDLSYNQIYWKLKVKRIQVYEFSNPREFKFIHKKDYGEIKGELSSKEELLEWKKKRYITIYEVADLFGKEGKRMKAQTRERDYFIELINNLPKNVIVKINLSKPIKIGSSYINQVYSLDSIEKFKSNFISKPDAIKTLKITEKIFNKLIKKHNIHEYNLGFNLKYRFYPNSDIEKLKNDDMLKNSITHKIKESLVAEDDKSSYISLLKDDSSVQKIVDNRGFKNTKNDWKKRGYISAYELDILLGIPLSKIKKQIKFKYYKSSTNNLPSGMVRFICLEKPCKIESGLPEVNELYSLKSIHLFLKGHINKEKAEKMLGVKGETFNNLVRSHGVSSYYLGYGVYFYPLEELRNLILYQENKKYVQGLYNKNKYVTIYEIAERIGQRTMNGNFILKLKSSLLSYNSLFSFIELPKRIHDTENKRYIDILYSRKDINNFFNSYISKQDAFQELLRVRSEKIVFKHYRKLNIEEIKLGGQQDSIFISKKDLEQLKKSVHNAYLEDYYRQKEILKILNITHKNYSKLVKEKLLVPVHYYKNAPFYDRQQVEKLLDEKRRLIEEARFYYSKREITEKYGINFAQNIRFNVSNNGYPIKTKTISFLISKELNIDVKGILYKKTDVDAYVKEYILMKELRNFSMPKDPFEEFTYKLESIIGFKFNDKQIHTRDAWFQYVKRSTNKQKYNSYNISKLARLTEMVFSKLTKELYTYTAKQINFLVLNENYPILKSFQRQFYEFMKNYLEAFDELLPAPYSIEDLNNPSDYENLIEYDTDIYPIGVYTELYEYASNIDQHKEIAIKDVKKYIENPTSNKNKDYLRYDSYWLYVLTLLTNNWRHGTVISQIPRIDLSTTRIESLDWLMNNTIEDDDADKIIFQIGRYLTKIEKTGYEAEEIFMVGEPMKTAFATAASICEFRRQALNENDPKLIWLDKNIRKSSRLHNTFFEDFISDFEFSNRKMNRTLATLIYSVLRHLGKGLKETRTSRSHLREETTINYYIKLSDQQVNKLVDELFERNHFGFVTQLMTDILYGPETNKQVETKRMVALNHEFGDADKINVTAGLLDLLASRRNEVVKYIQSLDIDELQKLQKQALAGILPSKQQYYQCIYSDCKFMDEYGEKPPCESCPASIVNVYALTNLMDNYLYYLESIVENFDVVTIGEKKRLANQFHIVYQKVDEARKKFGNGVVDEFAEGGKHRLKSLGKIVNSKRLKQFRTIDSTVKPS